MTERNYEKYKRKKGIVKYELNNDTFKNTTVNTISTSYRNLDVWKFAKINHSVGNINQRI